MLWLKDGRILKKERKGMNLMKKKNLCPKCQGSITPKDERCPHCRVRL